MFELIYQALNLHLIFNLAYWIPALLLCLVDMWKIFIGYKIQNKPADYIIQSYKMCLPTVILNTVILPIFPLMFLSWLVPIEACSDLRTIIELLIAIPLTDILFYTFHRLFHHKYFYKHFHKKHHEITAPIGISALYMTPMDLYFGNIVPVFLPLILIGAHYRTIVLWLILISVNTVLLAHSGFTWLADFHDYHHKVFRRNYGTNIFMDRIFGTYY